MVVENPAAESGSEEKGKEAGMTLEKARELLGVGEDATANEIKRALKDTKKRASDGFNPKDEALILEIKDLEKAKNILITENRKSRSQVPAEPEIPNPVSSEALPVNVAPPPEVLPTIGPVPTEPLTVKTPGGDSKKPEAPSASIEPLGPEQITYWANLLRKRGYHLEKLSPRLLRSALGDVYGQYLKQDEKGFFAKQDEGKIPKSARYSIKRAGDSLTGEDREFFDELRGLKEFLDTLDDKQVTGVLGTLFKIEKPQAKNPEGKKPKAEKSEEKNPEPKNEEANPQKAADFGEEKESLTVDELQQEIDKIDKLLGNPDLEKARKLNDGKPGSSETRLIERRAGFVVRQLKLKEQTSVPPQAKPAAAAAPGPGKARQDNEAREEELRKNNAKLQEAIDAPEKKAADQAKVDTKLGSGTQEIPVPEPGESDEEKKEREREKGAREDMNEMQALRDQAEEPVVPVAKIAPPLSRKEQFDAKKDELRLLDAQLENNKMYEGFGGEDSESGKKLWEQREKLVQEIGELTGEDLKKKVNRETKKKLGDKEMNEKKFKVREAPKILKEILAEQKDKAEKICQQSGWGKKLFDQDQEDNGTRFAFYMKQRLELSELKPEEFYGMICRGVRVDLFREKVAFWRTVGNFVTGNERVTNKYEIPLGAEGTDGVKKLSEKELEAFLFDQEKQQQDYVKKLQEEKFAQRLKKGREKLRETRAKVAEDIVSQLAVAEEQKAKEHEGIAGKLEELNLPALPEDVRAALMEAGYDLENMTAKYENLRGEDVGLLHKNMGAGTFVEYVIIPQKNGRILKIRKDEFLEKAMAFKEKFDKEKAKQSGKKKKPAEPVKKPKGPKKKEKGKEAPEPSASPKVAEPENAPKNEGGADLSLYARRETLKNKELDGTISPEEFAELLKFDFEELPSIPLGTWRNDFAEFDPERTLKEIKYETEGDSKKRKEKLEKFKELLELQREGLASCRIFIERFIELNNDVKKQVLMALVDKFSEKYGFALEQRNTIEGLIDSYYEKREKAWETWEKTRNGKNRREVIFELTGKELSDEDMEAIELISFDKMAIVIEISDEDVFNKMRNSDSVFAAAGFCNTSKDGVDYIFLMSHEKKEKYLAHEQQHTKNKLFREIFEEDERRKMLKKYQNEKNSENLLDYLKAEQTRGLRRAKDEIFATLHNNPKTLKEGLEQMFLSQEKGKYDYFKNIRVAEPYNENIKLSEKLFIDEYNTIIKDAVKSLIKLSDKTDYSKEMAIALLTDKELVQWPKTVDRILESKGIETQRQKNKTERKKARYKAAKDKKEAKPEKKIEEKPEPGVITELKSIPENKKAETLAKVRSFLEQDLKRWKNFLREHKNELDENKETAVIEGSITGREKILKQLNKFDDLLFYFDKSADLSSIEDWIDDENDTFEGWDYSYTDFDLSLDDDEPEEPKLPTVETKEKEKVDAILDSGAVKELKSMSEAERVATLERVRKFTEGLLKNYEDLLKEYKEELKVNNQTGVVENNIMSIQKDIKSCGAFDDFLNMLKTKGSVSSIDDWIDLRNTIFDGWYQEVEKIRTEKLKNN